MTKNSGRIIIAAALTAPWATVVVSAIWAGWYGATTPRFTPENLVYPDPDAPWEYVFLFSIYGIPTAYLSLVFFLTIYSILCQIRLISYRTIIAAGLLVCVPAALFMVELQVKTLAALCCFCFPMVLRCRYAFCGLRSRDRTKTAPTGSQLWMGKLKAATKHIERTEIN